MDKTLFKIIGTVIGALIIAVIQPEELPEIKEELLKKKI